MGGADLQIELTVLGEARAEPQQGADCGAHLQSVAGKRICVVEDGLVPKILAHKKIRNRCDAQRSEVARRAYSGAQQDRGTAVSSRRQDYLLRRVDLVGSADDPGRSSAVKEH